MVVNELERIAIEVATRCGELIVNERPEVVQVAQTKTSATDVVTLMDQRAEALARDMLSRYRPQDALFGEEGLDTAGSSGITWVVDPIDGTVNYLYNIPAFAVSVAAVEGNPRVAGQWRPLAGAVINPILGEVFHASLAGGSYCDTAGVSRRLETNPSQRLSSTLLATGFTYTADTRIWQGALIAELLPQVRDIRRMGSAALDLCSLAAGRVDAYLEHNLKPWDMAAGWLIATEAGATVRGLGQDYPSDVMTIAGAPAIVGELEEFMASWLEEHQVSVD